MAAPRVPLEMVWDNPEEVEQFYAHGEPGTVNAGIYQLNAAAISCLAPAGGAVVDLGSGPARMLVTLAGMRPDLRLCGVELSGIQLRLALGLLAEKHLEDRIELLEGNMVECDRLLAGRQLDVLETMWTLEHLTDGQALALFRAMAALREATGCALWVFDFVRQEDPEAFPQLLRTIGLTGPLLEVSIRAERAAFTTEELKGLLAQAGLAALRAASDSHGGGIYQAYWAPRSAAADSRSGPAERVHAPDFGPFAEVFEGLPR